MTDNPYAPPRSDLGAHAPADRSTARGDFEIGQCLSEAWEGTWANFPLWLVAGVVWLVCVALALVTVIGAFLVVPVLAWGAVLFCLRMYDRQADLGDLFAGFSRYGESLVGALVAGISLTLIGLLGQSVQMLGGFVESGLLSGIGGLVTLAWSVLVMSRLNLAYFYLVDQGLGPIEAIQQAWERTSRPKWKVAGMTLLSIAVMFAGLVALIVGMIPASVIVYLMWVSAYRQMEGGPAAA